MKVSLTVLLAAATLTLSAQEWVGTAYKETMSGTVLYASPYNFFIMRNGGNVVRVTSTQGVPRLKPGDEVKATGFPSMREGRHALEVGSYVRNGTGAALPPFEDLAEEFLQGLATDERADLAYGKRVRVKARVVSCLMTYQGEAEIKLDFGDMPVTVWHLGSLPAPLVKDLRLDPVIEAEGVLVFDNNDFKRKVVNFGIRVQSVEDIVVIPDGPFRRRRFLHSFARWMWLVPAVLLVLVAVLVTRLVAARSERRRLEAVMAERKRMSADLHDTIEQNIAMVRLYLESMIPADRSATPPNLQPVAHACDILTSMKREIRDTVWNLRIGELVGKDPREVLDSIAERVNDSGAARVRVRMQEFPAKIPERLFADTLYIVQEAMTNALKHGSATRILLAGGRNGSGYFISVVNNGSQFDVDAALGPETGHFGLLGMRERAKRHGIALSFRSWKRVGSVRMEVGK